MNITVRNNKNDSKSTLTEDTDISKVFKTAAYSVILVTSLLGNTFLILAIKRNINGRMRTVSNLLIASVAVSDLIMTVWSFPERITRVVADDSWLIPGIAGSILCKVVNFVEKLSITVSVLHLGALSLERFLAVFCPYKTVIKLSYVKYIVGCIWVFSALYWAPIFYYGDIVDMKQDLRCAVRSFVPHWREWYLVFIAILCAIMVTILVLYTSIAIKLCLRRDPTIKLVTQRQKSEHIKRRVVLMVGVIIVTFYLCFLPYWVGWVWCSYARSMPRKICNDTYKFISILFSYTSCMTNPIVCFTFIGYFRFAFKAILLDPFNLKAYELRLRLHRKSSITEMDTMIALQARKKPVKNPETQRLVPEKPTNLPRRGSEKQTQNDKLNGSTSVIETHTSSAHGKDQSNGKKDSTVVVKEAVSQTYTLYGTPL